MNSVSAFSQPSTSRQPTNRPDLTRLSAIRNPQAAGQLAVTRLNKQDKEAFLAVLDRLQEDGIHELDFSKQDISAEGMQCMADAFAERLAQGKRLGVTHLNFCDAKLGPPAPLIQALRQHAGGAIESMDFSGAYDQGPPGAGLSQEALTAIVRFPNNNQALREFKLNRQPGLASSLSILTTALQSSVLTTLALQDCNLSEEAWQHLKTCTGKDSGLTHLDLLGNDNMASNEHPDFFLLFLVSLNKNQTLVAVHLPASATAWYQAGIRNLPDGPVKTALGLQNNTSLRVLTPLSASDKAELRVLNENLSRNRWKHLEPKLALAGCLKDPFGVPAELRQKIAELVERIPPSPLQ